MSTEDWSHSSNAITQIVHERVLPIGKISFNETYDLVLLDIHPIAGVVLVLYEGLHSQDL